MSDSARIFGQRITGKKPTPKSVLKRAAEPMAEKNAASPGTDYDVAELNAQRVGQILKRVLARKKRNGIK